MNVVLEARHINKYFKKPVLFHVLKDINFQIKKGDFASIMGKSGCRKSTLLYILSTMDTDYEGELLFCEIIAFLGLSANLLESILIRLQLANMLCSLLYKRFVLHYIW
tara:strand:- start:7716 stop:8039 length:324 start_codon:yes stop_codon:yes gene_type:complete